MNILILNGNPDWGNTAFDSYVNSYQLRLHKMGHYVKTFHLRDMKISDIGKHDEYPVQEGCLLPEDDFKYVFTSLIETDLLVLASPLNQGLPSILTKIIQDRIDRKLHDELISTKVNQAGIHSGQRIPMIGIIVQKETDTTQQELLLNKLTQERIAANLMTVINFFITTESSLADTVCETLRCSDYLLNIENTYQNLLTGTSGRFDLL